MSGVSPIGRKQKGETLWESPPEMALVSSVSVTECLPEQTQCSAWTRER
jgi:hypothetical protein